MALWTLNRFLKWWLVRGIFPRILWDQISSLQNALSPLGQQHLLAHRPFMGKTILFNVALKLITVVQDLLTVTVLLNVTRMTHQKLTLRHTVTLRHWTAVNVLRASTFLLTVDFMTVASRQHLRSIHVT